MNAASIYEIPASDRERTTASPAILTTSVLALAMLFGPGTGGAATAAPVSAVGTSTGIVVANGTVTPKRVEENDVLSTEEKIAGIKHYLSLNMSDLATVLNVARPTVYQWERGPGALRSKHRLRIDAVYKAARAWRALSSAPMGAFVREPLAEGRNMLELLSGDLESPAIRDAMLQTKELQDRTEKRLTVAQVAQEAGVKLASRPRRNWRSMNDLDV
jgi:DNA-binding XRE family transcriptional regulator